MTAVAPPAVDAVPVASMVGVVRSHAGFPPFDEEAVGPADNRARIR
jgi:hypothetical protein